MDALAARFANLSIGDTIHHLCEKYCCSPMIRYQELMLMKVPDLSNPVHRIFRRENFNPQTIDYETFLPCLQLPSHFLVCNSAAVYITTVMDGIVRDSRGNPCPMPTQNAMRKGKCLSIWPRPGLELFKPVVKERSLQILHQLADMVYFTLDDFDDPATGAVNTPSPSNPFTTPFFPHGRRSVIKISRSMYNSLVELTRQESTRSTERSSMSPCSHALLTCRFHIARLLVHENSHALSRAAYGMSIDYMDGLKELCYMCSGVAEGGFEFEAKVFGGLVISLAATVSPAWPEQSPHRLFDKTLTIPQMAVTIDWPSPQIVDLYQSSPSYPRIWDGTPLPRYELTRRIPLSFFVDLFTDSYWKGHHNRQDALPIPITTVGCLLWWRPARSSNPSAFFKIPQQ